MGRATDDTPTTASLDVRVEFLSALARALARYGEDADDMEHRLAECARSLGVAAQFFVTPTLVMAAYGEDPTTRTVLQRVEEGHVDLEGLALVDDVARGVCSGEKTAPQALAELNLIATAPRRFPWYVRALASALGAGSFTIFLGGDLRSFVAALPVGLAVGLLVALASRFVRLQRLVELLGGVTAAVVTLALGHFIRHVSLPTVALSGVILLLPGLGVTIGVAELAARHLSSGTSRLAGATVTLVNLGVGSYLGFTLMQRLDLVPVPGGLRVAQTPWALVAATAATTLALFVATNARTRDLPLVLVSVLVALAGARLGAWLLGASLGVAVASLVLGLSANAFARLARRPPALLLTPGLAVLVPGALGLRGVSDFLRDATGGVDVLAKVVVIAAGLVVGLLVADAVLPPRPSSPTVREG